MKRINLFLASLSLMILGWSPSAYAVCDGCVTGAVQAANAAITAAIQTVNGTLQYQLQMLRNEQNSASTKVADAVGKAGDNVAQRNADTARANQDVELARKTQLPMDPCAQVARGLSDPDFDRVNPAIASGALHPRGGGGGGRPAPTTGSSTLDKAVLIANGDAPAPAPEVQAAMGQIGACEAYVPANSVRGRACQAATGNTPSLRSGLPNADVLAYTLFSGAQADGDVGKKLSLSFDDKQIAAANAYVRNLSNPMTLRDLSPQEARSDAGRAYLGLRDTYQARVDLAATPMNDWLANRVKYDKTIPVLKAMLDGGGAAAKYLQTELNKPENRDWQSKGVSLHQMMVIEAARRHQNPEWLKEISAQTDALTLAREQLLINAMMADLMTKQILETQRTNVYLGAIYQATLSRDMMPELVASHRKATASR